MKFQLSKFVPSRFIKWRDYEEKTKIVISFTCAFEETGDAEIMWDGIMQSFGKIVDNHDKIKAPGDPT